MHAPSGRPAGSLIGPTILTVADDLLSNLTSAEWVNPPARPSGDEVAGDHHGRSAWARTSSTRSG